MKFRKHTKFTAHVVRGFYLAAKRRSPEHKLSIAQAHGVREVRMPAGKLFYVERPVFIGEMCSQAGIERLEIQLFAEADCRCTILKIRQRALLKASMPPRPVLW